MTCGNCGNELKKGRKFCSNCGEIVERAKPNPSATSRNTRAKIHKKSKTTLLMVALVSVLAVCIAAAGFFLGPLLQESTLLQQGQGINNILGVNPDEDGLYPKDTAIAFLTYVQQGRYTEAHGLILGEFPIFLYEIEEEYSGIFQRLTFGAGDISEAINGDQASVTLIISAVDFAAVMEEVMAEAEAFFTLFQNITYEELMEQIDTMLIEGMTADDAPMVNNEVTIRLVLSEGRWLITADDLLADAVTGGMLSFVELIDQLHPY